VAIAAAAYTMPSAAGALVFGRLMSGRGGGQLAGWNAILRATALAAIPIAYVFGALNIALYIALLAASSLLAAWGSAGRYTLIAELLPPQHHLAANAVLTTIAEFSTIVGPPLAGILISWTNAALVIAIDAATFAILAATYRLATPASTTGRGDTPKSYTAGYRTIRHDRNLLGLLALTFGFFFLFGPFYVAMPIHVAEDLHASATVLGGYYAAFGIGAVAGGLATGYLRRWPLWPTTIGIVLAFAAAMLPLGLGAPTGISVTCFAFAGMIWAPYMPTSVALFQRATTTAKLPQVLAANGSITVLSVPLGTILGGPLVTAIGARGTLLVCAIATLALGAVAAGLTTRPRDQSATPAATSSETARVPETRCEADTHRD
jgi:predicted MFS family arabinose efflux permease